MRKHTVTWTEKHSVDIEAKNLAEAKKAVNEMSLVDLVKNPSYHIEISGLPKDTAKK